MVLAKTIFSLDIRRNNFVLLQSSSSNGVNLVDSCYQISDEFERRPTDSRCIFISTLLL